MTFQWMFLFLCLTSTVTVYGQEALSAFDKTLCCSSALCILSQKPWDLFFFLVVFKNACMAAG